MGGMKRWLTRRLKPALYARRRPSDDEMREELEAHVAMRAEHDRVDEAASRKRLGNMLRTREAMRPAFDGQIADLPIGRFGDHRLPGVQFTRTSAR